MSEQVSTVTQLRELLGHRAFGQICSLVTDRRDIFAFSASHLGISELELFRLLSDSLMLPLLTEPLHDLKAVMPQDITISDCQSQGFILFRTESNLHGIATIEPAWISDYHSRFSEIPLLLISWTKLNRWLQSSRTFTKNIHSFSTEGLESFTAKETLRALIRSASSIGANSLYLRFISGTVCYEVTGADDLKHQGAIKTQVAPGLECLLYPLPGNSTHCLQIEIDKRILSINVAMNFSESRLQLKWLPGLEVQSPYIQEHSIVQVANNA